MAKYSSRYNLTPINQQVTEIDQLQTLVIWKRTPTVGGWEVQWGSFKFDVPNSGMALLHHLKSTYVVPEWIQTRALFSHLFQNANAAIIEPHLALRVLIGVALKDQELQQALLPGLKSVLHMISEWLLLENSSTIFISSSVVGEYITSQMIRSVHRGICFFFSKLFKLHVVNDQGKASSLEIIMTGQQVIITRVNMGFLIEVRAINASGRENESVVQNPIQFGLIVESVLREHCPPDNTGPLNLTQYVNSRLAI
ncbi:membrane-associated protein VP24 [Dianlovirus menglaense]|uniref:Membrane-associated protein VP24 n=1 Tax=Dianlovirus menglaense TaxID=3052181 RepID=A0A3Q8U7A7_9MONO|nr:membrane-associated protein VP24 [Dianlovirus menglaense]AZL87828.1 membrane-associated protein VP24 [Dianlovirus menglaense]